jgi:hypothetical protein
MRLVYVILAVAAFWLMGRAPASVSRPVWVIVVALLWFGVMFGLLLRATLRSLERSLRGDVAMTPVGEDRMPEALRTLADRYSSLGLTRATPPLAVAMSNEAILVGFIQRDGDVAGSTFSIQPPIGATVTSYDFFSRFEDDRGALTTSPSRGGSVLRSTPGVLRQVFPHADPATLLQRHREALAWLSTQGVRARKLRIDEFEAVFRRALEQQQAAFRAARLGYALTAIWRTVTKATPNLGPLREQRGVEAAIRRFRPS